VAHVDEQQALVALPWLAKRLDNRLGLVVDLERATLIAEVSIHHRDIVVQAEQALVLGVAHEDRLRLVGVVERLLYAIELHADHQPADPRARPANLVAQGLEELSGRAEQIP